PFDGLSSRIFQATPLGRLAPARLAWIQAVKRSPVNLRGILAVPKGINSKAIALFASAELSRFRGTNENKHRENARKLLEMLRAESISGTAKNGERTTAFGYNFDWQSRAFYAPKGTRTIVPTAFAANAFLESYQLFGDEADLDVAKQVCEFILSDLQRPHETDDELCFSYTPGDSSLIFNSNLLAGEVLAAVGVLSGNEEFLNISAKTARYVIRHQKENGSWTYGPKLRHSWIDNFHTAFILTSLDRTGNLVPEIKSETDEAVQRGFDYWINNFFLDDGSPKYFDTQVFPLDVHSAASAIATLSELAKTDGRALPLAEKVMDWTVANLHDPGGFFYYQKCRRSTTKIPFIRWGQAWMAYALAKLIERSEFQL
ncbi:MAG TPA: hypothetical protein VK612_07280, partial [Pyrinomonadaceae bacterium]|nr:hypothetical protein [Pyrinomonadaceae bacterium]